MKKKSERNARPKTKHGDLHGKSAGRRKRSVRQGGSKPEMNDIGNVKKSARNARLGMTEKETLKEIVIVIVTVTVGIAIDREIETETETEIETPDEFQPGEIHISHLMTRKRRLLRPNKN